MMFKFIAFAVLVSMGLKQSECHEGDQTAEPDPVFALNKFLITTVDSGGSKDLDNFDKYKEALEQMVISEDKPRAKELRDLIIKLLPSGNPDFCGKTNLKTLSAVSEIVFDYDKYGRVYLKLANMLKKYTDNAWISCLDLLEDEFRDIAIELARYHNNLKLINDLFFRYAHERDPKTHDSLTYLHGAIENKRSTKPLDDRFFQGSVREQIDEMFCAKQQWEVEHKLCVLKMDEKTGEKPTLTFYEAKKALNEYILDPCSKFMSMERVATVLGRVVDLGGAVLDRNPNKEFEDKYEVLKWAPITLICQWFSEQNEDEIAKRIMRPWKERGASAPAKNKADYILNSWLVDHVIDNWDVYDNIKAIKELKLGQYSKDFMMKSAATQNLVRLISELEVDDEAKSCRVGNLKNLQAVTDALYRIEKDSFDIRLRRRRLNYVLYLYASSRQVECLDEFESKFATTETLKELNQYEILKKLDPVCKIDVDEEVTSQLKPLIGALSLPKEVQTSWILRTPSFEGQLMSALNNTRQAIEKETTEVGSDQATNTAESLTDEQTQATEDRTDKVGSVQETSKPKSMTVEEAKAYLNDNFFYKCKFLIDNESVQRILPRVIAIGQATRHVHLTLWMKDYKTLQWVPRFLLCRWLRDTGVEKFAKLLSKKTNEL